MKLIGIIGRAYFNKDNQEIIQVHDQTRKAFANYDNVTFITIFPTEKEYLRDIPAGTDEIDYKKLDFILDKCDGFISPGGSSFYNFEEYIIKYAIKNDKPLLGICCGFQAVCSAFAKNRTKFNMIVRADIPMHYKDKLKIAHKNTIIKGSLLHSILGKDEIEVNSAHHCIVDFPMKEIIVNSVAEDGIIESVEYPNKKFIMALQWHPEYLNDEDSKKIFDYFVDSL